ncbi:MAG: glutamate--tRNA ligase [Flavobacteriales bacterium]
MTKVRVRYAPSPTGPQHIGGIRTALYNYLFAKKHGGDFILRIEDTDQGRYVPGAEEYLIEAVKWCGFDFDEGVHVGGPHAPYRQSERKHLYRQYADQLLNSGNAYYAFDSAENLDGKRKAAEAEKKVWQYDASTRGEMQNSLTLSADEVAAKIKAGEAYVIRFKTPEEEEIVVNDLIRGRVVVNSKQLDDKVLFKSDGMPTYHLANIVDDHLMEITHVIRGEEWLPSAPLHVLLYRALSWESTMPQFAHLPLLLKPDGNGKLSKRDGDRLGFPVFPIDWKDPKTGELSSGYREAGYFPDAFLNLLAFLGWNPGTEQEIFSIEEMVQAFSLEKVSKSGAKFSLDKARWFNQQYLLKKSAKEILPLIEFPANNMSAAQLEKIVELLKPRCVFAKEIASSASYLFAPPTTYDAKTIEKKWKENSPQIVKDLSALFAAENDFSAAKLEAIFKAYLEQNQLGFGAAMPPLRLMITGLGEGPSLFDVMEILGKEECLERMKKQIVPKTQEQ